MESRRQPHAPEEGCRPTWIQETINYMTDVKSGSGAVSNLPSATVAVISLCHCD